ncbi:hypothetical protein HMPREF3180_02121 [Leptotrichia wadei]|jgi:hypothetical protein|uniref:Uncharacterized protein n=1 Tax=Leptotrichia wadei TaxID=157687 RepID=A0A133ZWV0_9FUSO|nr:hypothetical protein [Leptotrichia wadei]KXB59892.1 hypothetical protein HMPREF3180_02121 [Leptotrichia wadei]BBM47187.1 hypothetical protein JMUB3933_0687 [Leptotrichia wadei]
MIKLLIKIIILALISCCSKNNDNLFNNIKYKENIEKKPQKTLQKVSFDNKKLNNKEMTVSLKRIIDTVVTARKSKSYTLEKYDEDIFKKYREYFDDTTNNNEFFEKTSNLLLELKSELSNLNYVKNIKKSVKIKGANYSCSIQITKKPEKLGYVDGDVYGTVSCSSEYDSMSRFEEIYLKKVGEKYYILDLLIS